MSEFPYLYRNSRKEAKRYGELEKWRSSHQENIACRKDIEAVVSAGFDGKRLTEDCAFPTTENTIWSSWRKVRPPH